jgi:hypothetical protein
MEYKSVPMIDSQQKQIGRSIDRKVDGDGFWIQICRGTTACLVRWREYSSGCLDKKVLIGDFASQQNATWNPSPSRPRSDLEN